MWPNGRVYEGAWRDSEGVEIEADGITRRCTWRWGSLVTWAVIRTRGRDDMVNTGKAGEDAVADPGKLAEVEDKRRFLEGLIAIYELGVEFERHGRDPRRMTPAVLLEHFGVSYAEGHVRARDRFDELVGLLRSPRPSKGY